MVKMMTMETVTGWPADDCTRTTSTEARSDTDADTVYVLLPGSVDSSTIPQHRRPLSPQSLNTAGHWVHTQDSLVKPSSRSTTWYKNGTKCSLHHQITTLRLWYTKCLTVSPSSLSVIFILLRQEMGVKIIRLLIIYLLYTYYYHQSVTICWWL